MLTKGETEAQGLLGDLPKVLRTGRGDWSTDLPLTPPSASAVLSPTFSLALPSPSGAASLSPSPQLPSLISAACPAPQPQPWLLRLRSCWLRSLQLLLSERVQRCCLGTKHRWPGLRPPFPLQGPLWSGECRWGGVRPHTTFRVFSFREGRVLRPREVGVCLRSQGRPGESWDCSPPSPGGQEVGLSCLRCLQNLPASALPALASSFLSGPP